MTRLLNLIPSSWKREIKTKLGAPHTYWSIENLKRNGFDPKVIADVGAFTGEFTETVIKIFPRADFYLFEANPAKETGLRSLAKKHGPGIKVFMDCVSSTPGELVSFHLLEAASSVLDEHFEQGAPTVALTTRTLDEIFIAENIQKVDFVKLDVQGYELEALKGFTRYLPSLDVILIEVSLLDVHQGVPLFRDVVEFMYDFGFVAYDICSVSARRPLDMALWQTDLIFVRENSLFRRDKRYRA